MMSYIDVSAHSLEWGMATVIFIFMGIIILVLTAMYDAMLTFT